MKFNTARCEICNGSISQGGAAYTSHMRKHVRNNEATEYQRNGKLVFIKAGINITDTEPYAKLGNEPLPGQPKDVWEIPDIKTELPAIDPHSYYITSGEAVKKAEKMVQDCCVLLGKARAFRDKLRAARGVKKYLETSRDNERLLCKAKNPRNKETLNAKNED